MIHGQDPSLVYERKTKEIVLKDKKMLELIYSIPRVCHYPTRKFPIETNRVIVGFCGKLIPFFHFLGNRNFNDPDDAKRRLFDNLNDYISYLISNKYNSYKEKVLKELFEKNDMISLNLTKKSWDACQKRFDKENVEDFFIEINAPIFLILERGFSDHVIIKNPCLKDIGFESFKPPFEAFQEISMFLGNVLTSDKMPEVKITDNILRDEKGFDDWSFRKQKDERKRKQK